MKIAFFLNFRALCIGKPSKTFVQFWLYEEDPERARQVNPHPEWKGGKWMMFFESPNIDKKWERAVILYRQGKLNGIHAMKVSTMRENFKCKADRQPHVIIFYCGPSDNKKLMLEIGNNLLKQIKYKCLDGAMLYKADVSDDLPYANRVVLNRSLKSHARYRIQVPRY